MQSNVYQLEIVLQDANGFQHFKMGSALVVITDVN